MTRFADNRDGTIGRSDAAGGPVALVGSIQKFSVEDGPGIRSTVFLKGCPLNCRWCHNPELIAFEQQLIASPNSCIGCGACVAACPHQAVRPREGGGVSVDASRCDLCMACVDECYARALRPVAKAMTVRDVLDVALQDRDFYDSTGGGITISGGEALAHAEFAAALSDAAAEAGVNVCLDTCGYGAPDVLMDLATRENVTDILYDLKAVDTGLHERLTGVGNGLVLENLRMLAADGRTAGKVTLRMPLVSGLNDGDDAVAQAVSLACELGIRRVTLLSYHNLGVAKARNLGGSQEEFAAPSDERLVWIRQQFERHGISVETPGLDAGKGGGKERQSPVSPNGKKRAGLGADSGADHGADSRTDPGADSRSDPGAGSGRT